jgi:RNA polymerase sigma factor (sigma-70 family)
VSGGDGPTGRTPGAEPGAAPDRTALELLYRAEYAPSVRLAHLLTGDRARAEELAQDAFVRVARAVASVDNPAAYLRTTVVNLCRDAGRREARARSHPQPALRVEPPPPLPPTSTAVWAALQRLPERQRTAITLRFYLDLPDDEIARILGARPGTVRSLVHRALATLKEVVPDDRSD